MTDKSAIVEAARAGDVERVRALLDQGASTEATDEDGHTPFIAAGLRGHLDVVRVLLEASADTTVFGPMSETTISSALDLDDPAPIQVLCRRALPAPPSLARLESLAYGIGDVVGRSSPAPMDDEGSDEGPWALHVESDEYGEHGLDLVLGGSSWVEQSIAMLVARDQAFSGIMAVKAIAHAFGHGVECGLVVEPPPHAYDTSPRSPGFLLTKPSEFGLDGLDDTIYAVGLEDYEAEMSPDALLNEIRRREPLGVTRF